MGKLLCLLREWRDLSEPQKKYMIQISPPADVMVQSVRSLVDIQSMTSAVVMFDEEQYGESLLDFQCRY